MAGELKDEVMAVNAFADGAEKAGSATTAFSGDKDGWKQAESVPEPAPEHLRIISASPDEAEMNVLKPASPSNLRPLDSPVESSWPVQSP